MIEYVYTLIIMFSFSNTYFCNIISKRFEFYTHQLQIKVKSNERELSGIIDISSPYSYSASNLLLPSSEKKPKEIRTFMIQENGIEYSVHEFQELINLNEDIQLNSFNYFVFDRSYYNKYKPLASFAFGFHIYNELHSLTHLLSNGNPIIKSKFSLAFPNNVEEDYGYLFIGDTPKEKMGKEHFNYNSSISIIGNKRYWQAELTNIIIPESSVVYHTKQYFTYFSTLTPYILLPKTIFEELIKIYFGNYLKNNKCKRFGYGVKEYDCSCSIVKELPSIGFVIDNSYFLISSADLFFPYENLCVFNIISNEEEYGVNTNDIVFGIRFLWNFVSEFNYENKSITLFSSKPFININSIKSLLEKGLILSLLKITIFFLIVALIYIVYVKFKI